MSESKYLAIDLGAESGRVILGTIKANKINLQEIHRFPNRPVEVFGHIYWDLLRLIDEIKKGMSKTAELGYHDLAAIGIDTWGVDFGLVGNNSTVLGNPYAYRDRRTDGVMEKTFEKIPRSEMYRSTGIQFMQFNSIFQLYSMVLDNHSLLGISECLLFMPDLLNYVLTGERVSEYTIASTSQLLNPFKKTWEPTLFDKLELPLNIMPPVIRPGTKIGKLLPTIAKNCGLNNCDVVAPGCHDTASAVAAVPAQDADWMYLSSGTWSLMGVEVEDPIISDDSLGDNFTNEGGVGNTIRFLRNIMGLWLLQGCRRSWGRDGEHLDYDRIVQLARQAKPFKSLVDPDDAMFLNPKDMTEAIGLFCKKTQQPVPESKGEYARCVFESLALKYRSIVDMVSNMQGKRARYLHIVGGGSQNQLLNQFAANATGLEVISGPVEATAIGNIMLQAVGQKQLDSIADGREIVANSFPVEHYLPAEREAWDEAYQRFAGFKK